MRDRSEQIGERVRDLTVRAGAEAMRSLQRYNELLQRIAGGELDDKGAYGAYLQFTRDETERYLRNVSDLSTGYWDALLELGSIYSPPFFENAFNRWQPRRQPSAQRGGVIELRGSPGDEAIGAFLVENESGNRDEVAFVVSEFTGRPGTAPFTPPLKLQPARFVLERFESQLVSVRLPLVAGIFLPDQHYTAVVTVRKRDTFDLTIDVEVILPSQRRSERTTLDERAS